MVNIEAPATKAPPAWTLLTSHGLVLLYVARHADATIREIAGQLLITERRVASIIKDLVDTDLLLVRRQGRRNHYTLSTAAKFRHPIIDELDFQAFVDLWRATDGRDSD